MKILLLLSCGLLIARVPAIESPTATPSIYINVLSLGPAAGLNWIITTQAQHRSWFNLGASAIQGTDFINSRLGFGLSLIEATAIPGPNKMILVNTAGLLSPTVTWITNASSHSFGYLDLQVTPYFPGISALAVDYGFVPFPPWPIEARVRAASTIFWQPPRQTAYELTAGIRVGLGYWVMRR